MNDLTMSGVLVSGSDALDRHGRLGHDRLVGVQRDFVESLGHLRAVQRLGAVGVGDRLVGHHGLVVGDRDGRGDRLDHSAPGQPAPVGRTRSGSALQALLPTGRRHVGGVIKCLVRKAGTVQLTEARRIAELARRATTVSALVRRKGPARRRLGCADQVLSARVT